MQITYIGHSGFLIEWDSCYMLFDYFIGEIPMMDKTKKIFIFASHKHEDHFNPKIFQLCDQFENIEYVLSSDIRLNKDKLIKLGLKEEILDKTLSVKPENQYELYDNHGNHIILKTLNSTDCGVAFLIKYQGMTVYHAGDLNLWAFKGESKQYNNNMTARFHKIIEELKDVTIDLAFAPLDPRQEEYYYLGLEYLINTANVTYAFPMHFWNDRAIINKFINERADNLNNTKIMDVLQSGQTWKFKD